MRCPPLVLLVVAAACGGPARTTAPAEPPVPAAAAPAPERTTLAATGIDPTWLDRSAAPCDDFYRFACGGFLDHAEIPADLPSWRPATQLRAANEAYLHDLLERARGAPDTDPVLGGLGAFYNACMDEAARDAAGLAPIQPLLDAIARVRDRRSLEDATIALHQVGVTALFWLGAYQDLDDSQHMIGWIDQAGLGLPEREYYLDTDAHAAELRGKYEHHIARMFELAGDKPAAAARAAHAVVHLETELAKLSMPRLDRRDSNKIHHRLERAQLIAAAPSFAWPRYLAARGLADLPQVNVTSPAYLTAVTALVAREPAAWQPYLRWRVLDAFAASLSKDLVQEDFAMRQVLTGQAQLEPRWKICVRAANDNLAELVAQPFIASRFSDQARALMGDIIDHVRAAMRDDLAHLAWMDDATRTAARAKLDKMRAFVAAPSHPKTYDFAISRIDHGHNMIAAARFAVEHELHTIGKPVDPEDWSMPPITVDAFYSSSVNSMNFPVGDLQPPSFSERSAAAVNYGRVGSTIGHELTHGFDDDGAKYDGDGNLREWWSASAKAEFATRTRCVIEQYNAYEPLPGLKVNGAASVGENIADIGGLKLAFAAYRAARAGARPVIADGFTEDQMFFIAYAQDWCDKQRPENVEMNLRSDPHTPRRFRVNGVVADNPAFATAFACPRDTAMNPAARCEVW